jgi:protein SCO1/2
MRSIAALTLCFALLAGCSDPKWHMTDISGGMPRLDLRMTENGRPVTGQTYRGKVVLLYFGFTHCPDICPTTLANLANVLDRVKSPDVQVLFVTVDPDRDTPEVLADYTKVFSPQITGLRGSPNQLASLARTYRVAYEVDKGPPYEVMHANTVFVFDRDGRARLVTTDTSDTAAVADDLKRLLRE